MKYLYKIFIYASTSNVSYIQRKINLIFGKTIFTIKQTLMMEGKFFVVLYKKMFEIYLFFVRVTLFFVLIHFGFWHKFDRKIKVWFRYVDKGLIINTINTEVGLVGKLIFRFIRN